MARKRFVTSEMSTDKIIAKIAEINPTAALMWPWFITNFDDWGRMGADPMELKLTLFPAFPFTSKEIGEVIKLYDEIGLAYSYEIDNKPYLAVNPDTFYKYQTYINSERKEKNTSSKYPAPLSPPWESENQQISAKVADNQQTSAKIVPSPSLSLNNIYSVFFEKFWTLYPRRKEKQKAFNKWNTRLKEGYTEEQLTLAAENYAKECKDKEVKFIKHAATFLGPDKPFTEYLKKPENKSEEKSANEKAEEYFKSIGVV